MTNTRIYRLFMHYFSDTLTREEFEELKFHINGTDNDRLLSELTAAWEDYPAKEIACNPVTDNAFKIIETHARPARIHFTRWFRMAAMFLLPVLCTLVTYLYMNEKVLPYTDRQVVVQTENGHRAALTLPDGSGVRLNSGSYLSYPQNFGKEERLVTLSGEAFFEVAKKQGKKFIVRTEYMNIEVMGTTFNVYAYEKENTVEMVLLTGQVKINTNKAPYRYVYVNPNEKISLDKLSGALHVRKTDARFETAWLRNEIVFRSEKLKNVFNKLERKYGVTIEKENFRQDNDLFTGSFNNDDLTGILDILKRHYHFEYKVTGNKIILYGRK